MKQRIFAVMVLFFLFCCAVYSDVEARYTITGELMVLKAGTIYLKLVTEEQYKKDLEDDAVAMARVIPAKEEIKNKKAFFEFKDIPPGIYTIKCFQDLNANNKMDIGIMGFGMEPYGYYKPGKGFFGPPAFKNIKFELTQDLIGIQLILIY